MTEQPSFPFDDFSEWEDQTVSFEFEVDEERLPDEASPLQANFSLTRDEDLLKARGYAPHVGIDLTRLVYEIDPPQDYPQTGRYFRVQTDVSFRIGHEVSDDQLDWVSAQLTVFLHGANPPLARAVDLFPRYELTETEVVTPEPVRWVIAPQLELDPSKLKGSIGSLAGQWERSRTPHCTGQLGDGGTRPVWQFKRNATLPLSSGMARTWFLLHLPDGVPFVRAGMGLTGSLRAPLLPSLPFIPIRVPFTRHRPSIRIPE